MNRDAILKLLQDLDAETTGLKQILTGERDGEFDEKDEYGFVDDFTSENEDHAIREHAIHIERLAEEIEIEAYKEEGDT